MQMNLPNKLTILRVLMIPFFVLFMLMDITGAADKWILLANATDETNLHNKLVLDLAEQVGLGWVPEHIYTDVYLNGTYNGLYLLIEKPEVGSSRLNLDSNNGFLCKVDLEDRWSKLDNPYKTGMGRTLEISSPKTPQTHSCQKSTVP